MNSIAAPLSAPPVELGDAPFTPDAEAEHLRHLIEKQPCCLMRVGLDGLVLAANDAACQQLGGREPIEVLGHLFTEWIVPEHHAQWHDLAARIRDGGSGSAECDLAGLESARYQVLMQGVLLADHPDGVASMILVMRDISATRRLEEAIQEHASARQAIADEHQLALLFKEREGRQQVNALQSKLDWAEGEHIRLKGMLEEQASSGQALVARLNAERAEFERGLAVTRTEKEQALKALADLRVELQTLEENTRGLEPLASAGRLALEVGRELQLKVAAVNAGARALLLRSEEPSADRQLIEALLADAIGAASLARQFVQGSIAPADGPTPRDVTPGAVDRSDDSGRMS